MDLTPAQSTAVAARGNVVVVAGAGTGKTRTLVERCLACLSDPKSPASLDEILVVTFTDAAAAEMRQRIRAGLEEKLAADPGQLRWHEQLALFETAHIGTLHSFCLRLIREHFYQLELDPQLTVLTQEEVKMLAEATLDDLFEGHYAGRAPNAESVQDLVQIQGGGQDRKIRDLISRIHDYTQTLPDPAGWLREQSASFEKSEPIKWRAWFPQALRDWAAEWQPRLEHEFPGNQLARKCAPLAGQIAAQSFDAGEDAVRSSADCLKKIVAVGESCPFGKKTQWLEPLESFFEEAAFLLSLKSGAGDADPLDEDWSWVREQMRTLLNLTAEFTSRFSDAKRELGAADFHDLEQHTLRLLWDTSSRQRTEVARQWQEKLRFIFVDEYQDINAAQDTIIEALSRDGADSNRFLVGDVKQSIYRFRLANPRIFQHYVENWSRNAGASPAPANCAIPLVENFRSRERCLDFINSLFGKIMRREVGGISYDERTRLQFGSGPERAALRAESDSGPRVELCLLSKGNANDDDEEQEESEIAGLEDAAREARLVASRIRQLKREGHQVWDEERTAFRPMEWHDVAILLRSPAGKAESFAKEFARLGIPLQVERGGFYDSSEIMDLMNLMHLLDNPLDDLAVLAVLHSPLVGLTVNELASIRLAAQGPFWGALIAWQHGASDRTSRSDDGPHDPETARKVALFLERFGRWRRAVRQGSLVRCLESVLAETHYLAYLAGQPRGAQRQANVRRLLAMALRFDQFQRQGLFRFLCFVKAQRDSQAEPASASQSGEDRVRLMSIHQSKGLEFPVVVVANLGKRFNTTDLRADIILDEDFGVCPQVKSPKAGKRYPSLPLWLARRRQQRELLGEELRLLYVAMTRARDTLLLSGVVTEKKLKKVWGGQGYLSPGALADASSYADWIGHWFAEQFGNAAAGKGGNALVGWTVHKEAELAAIGPELSEAGDTIAQQDLAAWPNIQRQFQWRYLFQPATRQQAKMSVTALRRQAQSQTEQADTFSDALEPWLKALEEGEGDARSARSKRSKEQVGSVHHLFLERVKLEASGSIDGLKSEASRLVSEGVLSEEDRELLDFEGIAAFWAGEIGARILNEAAVVKRELAFTARFSPAELAELTSRQLETGLDEEAVVVQGVADLVVLWPDQIWVVDFKTDRVLQAGLAGKVSAYEPQLRLYAQALTRVYRRPVTGCWLYFLALRQTVAVNLQPAIPHHPQL